jgi:hypothetical protein
MQNSGLIRDICVQRIYQLQLYTAYKARKKKRNWLINCAIETIAKFK